MRDLSIIVMVIVAFLGGLIITWLVRYFAQARGIVNHPNPLIPQHTKSVAYLGGVAILIAIAVVVAILQLLDSIGLMSAPDWSIVCWQIVVPAVLFTIMGTADDLLIFSPWQKLALQLALSTLAVWLGNGVPITGYSWVDSVVSILWFVVIVNAFNLTDVCDGLLSGITLVMFIALAFLLQEAASVCFLFSGVLLGFLVFNFPPASIYLGDGGSHFLGFICAALLLTAMRQQPTWLFASSALLLIAVPLFELVFLVIVRVRKGLPWWRGSPDHFSLRLQQAGLPRDGAVLVALIAAAIFAAIGVALSSMPAMLRWISLAIVIAVLIVSWSLLLRWEVSDDV